MVGYPTRRKSEPGEKKRGKQKTKEGHVEYPSLTRREWYNEGSPPPILTGIPSSRAAGDTLKKFTGASAPMCNDLWCNVVRVRVRVQRDSGSLGVATKPLSTTEVLLRVLFLSDFSFQDVLYFVSLPLPPSKAGGPLNSLFPLLSSRHCTHSS